MTSAWETLSSVPIVGPAPSAPPEVPLPQPPLPLPPGLLGAESRFYGRHRWALDAFPDVGTVRDQLRELTSAEEPAEDWEREEACVNLFLLSCALSDSVDDYLAGDRYDFSQATSFLPPLRVLASVAERVLEARRRRRTRRLQGLRSWREEWGAALEAHLQAWLDPARPEAGPRAHAREDLAALVGRDLPADLLARRTKVPAAFRTQDFTHHDVVELAARFEAAFPDRRRAVLLVGLRTAGSYFAPLVRAALVLRGYGDVEAVTVRPKKGTAPWERAALARCAARGGLAVVLDEPAFTGSTLAKAVELLGRAGVPARDVVVLMPVHPTHRDWKDSYECLPLVRATVLTLLPEDWHKHRLLATDAAAREIERYFRARGYLTVAVEPSAAAEAFNRDLEQGSDEKFHTRLKRVYEVRLSDQERREETRYVLAKSVGWGWLGYHAFLAAEALAEFVPPVLGLRQGILYTEWLPQRAGLALGDRAALVRRAASYVAARVRTLRLEADPGPELDPRHQKGLDLLANALSGAYGLKPAAVLKRARLRHELSRRACPAPTLIDGKMRRQEWVSGAGSLLKTDFEQHGLGKTELNVTDPAFDLAEAILHFGLSQAEEEALLDHYRAASGDAGVADRLLLNALLAGLAAMSAALDSLKDPRLAHRHQEFNRAYLEARDFLTIRFARLCGRLSRPAAAPGWRSPLVVMDVDGVLDKQVFGFPSTTAAGMEAVSLLHAHGHALALDTARTLDEVKEYCRDYGCVGGVAEYGCVVWDAVTDRTQVLVGPESRAELKRLEEALRHIPGVFLNDRYEHSLRAYAYEGDRTVPLPAALVRGALAQLGLRRLSLHQTYLDSTILPREVDKGRGLLALLRLAGHEEVETIAIGDSEPDLAMFAVATRSFAPSHMSGRGPARLLGCHIADRPYQGGLLGAARRIVHPDLTRCGECRPCPAPADPLLRELLSTADRRPLASLLRAMTDPVALQAFVR